MPRKKKREKNEIPEKPEICTFWCPYSLEDKASWGACETFNMIYCDILDRQMDKGVICPVDDNQLKRYLKTMKA